MSIMLSFAVRLMLLLLQLLLLLLAAERGSSLDESTDYWPPETHMLMQEPDYFDSETWQHIPETDLINMIPELFY
ncbi:unnamed protein product [Echinostoma caproni]|uniref:Secreted protein n=1 Tax=Echinostoma caproni TaxID=27848 RepID=A0A183A893_9TREM|nr:unnamed protein product [Echinostoma caproni]